mmetsp:Transcript_58861/g.131655  ORF Transcript_58861/g.131655 Transcript_58861/m.131655 type:complete len:201 (+) Transcript_58861:2-604(+)
MAARATTMTTPTICNARGMGASFTSWARFARSVSSPRNSAAYSYSDLYLFANSSTEPSTFRLPAVSSSMSASYAAAIFLKFSRASGSLGLRSGCSVATNFRNRFLITCTLESSSTPRIPQALSRSTVRDSWARVAADLTMPLGRASPCWANPRPQTNDLHTAERLRTSIKPSSATAPHLDLRCTRLEARTTIANSKWATP